MLAIVEPQDGQTLTVAAGATAFSIAAAIFQFLDVQPGDRLCAAGVGMIIRSVDPDNGNGVLLQGWPGPAQTAATDWYIEQSQASRQSFVASTEQVATANSWLARILSQATPWAVLDRVSAPPAGPVEGDTYLASPTATGGFQPNLIYRFQSAAWVPVPPHKGDIVFIVASRQTMGWDGTAWGAASPAAGTVGTASLADAAVSNAKLADMAAGTIKLRALGAGSGPPVDGTPAQARAIVQVIDPTPNLIVNGAMQHSQEYGDTAVSLTGVGAWPHIVDQTYVGVVGTGVVSVQRVTGITPGGSGHRIRIAVTTAKPTLAAPDILVLQQPIEARNFGITKFGSLGARRLLGSFVFRGPAGTYGWRVANTGSDRVWVGTFSITVAQAGIDTIQTISVDPDSTGSWDLNSTGVGAIFTVCLATGSNYFGSVGWSNGNKLSTNAQFNGLASTSYVFEIGDIDLYPDVSGIGTARPFTQPDQTLELLRCQRYYFRLASMIEAYSSQLSTDGYRTMLVRFPVAMRVAPTCAITGYATGEFAAGGYPYVSGVAAEYLTARMDVSFSGYWSRLTSVVANARF